MPRSIASRLKQKQRSNEWAKRSRSESIVRSPREPKEFARVHKRARVDLGQASQIEEIASRERLEQTCKTVERNACNQHQYTKQKRQNSDEARFFAAIDAPLTLVCASCGERVSPENISVVPYSSTDRRFKLLEVPQSDGTVSRGLVDAGMATMTGIESAHFCSRCKLSLAQRRQPLFSEASGFKLSAVPPCLALLNPMEARMIGLGICFTTCFTLGNQGQAATRGNSINFWNDSYDIITKLPRPQRRCGVIQLKAPGSSTSPTYYHVRPWLLREALVWLKAHNDVYKDITIDEKYLEGLPTSDGVASVDLEPEDHSTSATEPSPLLDEDDAFEETFVLCGESSDQREDERIEHALDEQGDQAYILQRNDRPINEYSTKMLMQSCFPTLFPNGYGGYHPLEPLEKRRHDYKLAEYCSHLMAWHDRRFVMHPTFKFFCLNLIQRRQVDGLLKQVKSSPLGEPSSTVDADVEDALIDTTANHSKSSTNPAKVYLRQLRPFFRSVRGTGLYWANVREDLMAMIGSPALDNKWPTFFVTLSAADTIWPDFFRACDPALTFEEAASLSATKKRKYLNANPDLAAHHFHRRFQAFFRHILCGKEQPLGDIADFFWRIEFQRRGSPHVHALFWIKGAPDILERSKTPEGIAELAAFADKFVSCMRFGNPITCTDVNYVDPLCRRPPLSSNTPARNQDLADLVSRVQTHVCSSRSSCQRDGKCRFDFPKALVPATKITREETRGCVKIRIDHKRDSDAVNNFNPSLLSSWRANMDVKVIGNAYGAAEYTAAYISKAEPDSVRFLRTIQQALDKLPAGVPQERLLKRTATTLLAIREVSAQETVYILSNTLCLYGKSRSVLKVKVTRHDRRYYRVPLNSQAAHAQPSQECGRIEEIEKVYMNRPRTPVFDELSYRQFCESYEPSREAPAPSQQLQRFKLDGEGGYIKAKTQKQVIRASPKYRADENDANYCYAQLFLNMPWRSLADLPTADSDILDAYERWKAEGPRPLVNVVLEAIDRQHMISAAEEQEEEVMVLPTPNWVIGFPVEETYESPVGTSPVITPPFPSRYQYSNDDIGRAKSFLNDVVRPYLTSRQHETTHVSEAAPLIYPTHDQIPAMTEDQWKPFACWMNQNRIRLSASAGSNVQHCKPLVMVVSGEGGTGKSWLIQQIVQDVKVVFGVHEAKRRVLLLAHQGSAAYLIGGRTISSVLALPVLCNFRTPYVPLVSTNAGQTSLRRLQNDLEDVHLVVIDEYGVISAGQLCWIDQRLREIFPQNRNQPFGGRDLLFTGDPGQLGPVSPSSLSTPIDMLATESERQGRRAWVAIPVFFLLRQQNRGQDDPAWYDMLRRVRDGNPTDGDVQLINTRVMPAPVDQTATRLSYRNCDVDDANDAALHRTDSLIFNFNARHDVQRKVTALAHSDDKETVIRLLQEAAEMTSPSAKCLPLRLSITIGAPVVLTFNLEQRVGLCNGTRAIVYDIIDDDRTPAHLPIVLVQVPDYNGPSFLENVSRIVPILSRTTTLMSNKQCAFRVSRTALPLRLGYATTIHKIQGQTCSKVVFNPSSLRNSALAYVALSRVRSSKDLFLTKMIEKSQLQKSTKDKDVDARETTRLNGIEKRSCSGLGELLLAMKLLAALHNQHMLQ